jgi:hypothetical protein
MITDHTLDQVGRQFSVTRERIRQIEAKALRKLKHPSRARALIVERHERVARESELRQHDEKTIFLSGRSLLAALIARRLVREEPLKVA